MVSENKPATVLAVDDSPQNLSLVSGILESQFAVKLAPSGAKALSILSASKVDLVLLDIMMPEMDGFEVCRRIKQNPDTRAVPVIFVTAVDEKQATEDWRALGAAGYITKPIDPDELVQKVRDALHG